jgi:hypothetical protein
MFIIKVKTEMEWGGILPSSTVNTASFERMDQKISQTRHSKIMPITVQII